MGHEFLGRLLAQSYKLRGGRHPIIARMSQLRRIALWIQETETDTFRWVLTEADGRRLRDLRSSEHEFISFEGALDEGVDALKNMCSDVDIGPREPIEDEEAEVLG